MGFGLLPLPPDQRDFSLGAIPFLRPEKVPDFDFEIPSAEVEDQKETDFCVGFSTGVANATQEKKRLNMYWPWAWAKKETGDVEGFGLDLRSGMRAHVKVGAPEYDSKFSLETQSPQFLRYFENYPKEYEEQAVIHKKQAYFSVGGLRTVYDSIVATLWKYQDEQRVIPTGMLWRSGWNVTDGVVPSVVGPDGDFGHSFFWKGQKYIRGKRHLIAQLSNGEDVGDKGLMYFPESIVNQEATYGNFMFLDYPAGWTKDDIIATSQEYRAGFYGKVGIYFKRFFLWTK